MRRRQKLVSVLRSSLLRRMERRLRYLARRSPRGEGGCACRLEKNACDRRASDISLALPEVTGVIFKMTSPKKFHPRYAVGLFSRVCTTRTPGKMYRCEQEKVCQTLENKTTSTERHRCHLEKNGRDRRAQGFQESRQLRFLARRSLLAKAAALCAMHLNPRILESLNPIS